MMIPYSVDKGQELQWIAQELEQWSKDQGYPPHLEYMRQCGYWEEKPRSNGREWYMELGGYPVDSIDVEYCKNEKDDIGIKVYHWKGDHRAYWMGNWQEGNLEFDGVKRKFTGEIATRGF